MSKMTIESTITPTYLRNKTKDEIIDLFMLSLKENDALKAKVEAAEKMAEALKAIAKEGTQEQTQRVGDMYAEDGYSTFTVVSIEANIARAALEAWKEACK